MYSGHLLPEGTRSWVGIEEGKEDEVDMHPEITALTTHADDEKYIANTPWAYKDQMTFNFPEGPHAGDVQTGAWKPFG